MSETEHALEFPDAIIFASMFNNIADHTSKKVQGQCRDSAKEVVPFAARFRPRYWCFCGPGILTSMKGKPGMHFKNVPQTQSHAREYGIGVQEMLCVLRCEETVSAQGASSASCSSPRFDPGNISPLSHHISQVCAVQDHLSHHAHSTRTVGDHFLRCNLPVCAVGDHVLF